MMQLTLGCTTRPYSSLSFAEACARIAEAGYSDVAVFANEGQVPVRSDSSPDEVAAAREAAAQAGVQPSMLIGRTRLDLGLEAAIEDYKRLIDNAAALGTKWLLDCGTGKPEWFDDFFQVMREAAPYAEEKGMAITLKPHGGVTLTAQDLIDAYEKVNHPGFGICYDPGNIIYYTKGEQRPETALDEVAPTVNTAIIKDCTLHDGQPDVMVTPGEGLVDFEKVLGGLIAGGFRGPLYLECVGGKEIEEIHANVRATRSFIRQILESL